MRLTPNRTVACLLLVVSSPVSLLVLLLPPSPSISQRLRPRPSVDVWFRCNNGQSGCLARFIIYHSRGTCRSITWGIFLQYFVEFGCSYLNGTPSFRIPWGLQMIPAVILSLGMMFFPEVS